MPLAHHSLVAWQRADDLFIRLHRLSLKQFPAIERIELGGQTRRAAFSVAANIAEGFAYQSARSRLRFLNIAKASLAEVGYCVHVAQRLGYISEVLAQEIDLQIRQTAAPLVGLIRADRAAIGLKVVGVLIVFACLAARLG